MTTMEEIVVSGTDFIERRIFVSPVQADIKHLQDLAYRRGYRRGWLCGLVFGMALFGIGAILMWSILY